MVSHPETGSDSPIGSDRDRGRDKEIRLLRVRRHRRVKMRRSKPCFPRLLIQNRKSGPNRLQRGVKAFYPPKNPAFNLKIWLFIVSYIISLLSSAEH